jgi:hypothetical protein
MNEEILDRYDEIQDELTILKWWSDFRTEYLKGAIVFCIGALFICFIYLFIFMKLDPTVNMILLSVYLSLSVLLSLLFTKMIRKMEIANFRSSNQIYSNTKRNIFITISIILAFIIPVVAFLGVIITIIGNHC